MKIANEPLPKRGLVLVFGESMSGKDVCVRNAILESAEKSAGEVMVLSEAQVSIGNAAYGLPDRSDEHIGRIKALMARYLVVLVTQGSSNYPPDFQQFILSMASAVIVLRSRDRAVGDFIMERTYRKWFFIKTRLPDPSHYVSASQSGQYAEAAICVRFGPPRPRSDDSWDKIRLARLPILTSPQLTNQAGSDGSLNNVRQGLLPPPSEQNQ